MFGLGNTSLMLRQGLPLLSCKDNCISVQPDDQQGSCRSLELLLLIHEDFPSTYFYGSSKVFLFDER